MHDTNERASERLAAILDRSPPILTEEGLDVWQAYGLHWLLAEIVGFVVQCDPGDDPDRTKVYDIAYSLRRWAHELHAGEDVVMEAFNALQKMGIIRVTKEKAGMVRVGLPHLDTYADRIWNPRRTQQQKERREQRRQTDSESTPSRLRTKDVRTTRKGKDVRTNDERRVGGTVTRFHRPSAPVGGGQSPAGTARVVEKPEPAALTRDQRAQRIDILLSARKLVEQFNRGQQLNEEQMGWLKRPHPTFEIEWLPAKETKQ